MAQTQPTVVTIRPARPGEAGRVFDLIKALAEYERLSHAVVATEADLDRALFATPPVAFCDLAESAGEVLGFALWFRTFSTFTGRGGIHLEDLYVLPQARGRGAGLALLQGLARRCEAEGLARLEWAVLDWNAPAIAFYDRLGAATLSDWITRRLDGEALKRLARA